MPSHTTLAELCAEALHGNPDGAAIEFEGKWFSRGDMRNLANQLDALIDTSGAGPRPMVAFIARNRPSTLAAFLSLLARSCTVRMIYPFQSSEALAAELERLEPDIVIASASDLAQVVLDVLGEKKIAAIALGEMHAAAIEGLERAQRREGEQDPPRVILLTSGTSGPPKPFSLDYETIARYFSGNLAMTPGGQVDDSTPTLLYFPVSNVSGLYSTLPPLLRGTPIILLDRFRLDDWHAYVKRYRPKIHGLPPVGYKMVLDADIPREDLASLDYLGAGAAPLDLDIHRAFEAHYGIPILLSYGATEFAGPVCAMTPALWPEWGALKIGSVGRPLPGMQLRVVDRETGRELAAGEEGIIEVVSARIGPEWIRTSDAGLIDEDGFLFLRGRVDGAIMRGGFKILPATIEQALLQHPAIAETAVVPVKDERLGQVPGAVLIIKPGATPVTATDLEAHLRKRILATHIPVHWRFIDELPRTPSMKVNIPAVRQLFE